MNETLEESKTPLERITEGYTKVKDLKTLSNNKKKYIVIATNHSAASLDGAQIENDKLITKDNEYFVCLNSSCKDHCSIPVLEDGVMFKTPQSYIKIVKPIEDVSNKKSFLSTLPPPSIPSGLKLRYKPFGCKRPSDDVTITDVSSHKKKKSKKKDKK